MPYEKPGIEIKQEQRSSTPVLPSPELKSCLIGYGYHWQDPNWDDESIANENSIFSSKYDGSSLTIPASGINDTHYDLVSGSVVVDLVGTKGPSTGTLTHLRPGDDFSVAGNDITISGSAGPYTEANSEEAQVRVGFLAYNSEANGQFQRITSSSEVEQLLGEPVSWNPLAYCTTLAIQNSSSETYIYTLSDEAGSEVTHADARDELALHEVYSLAVLDGTADVSAYANHVETQSSPTGKKERIVFVNDEYAYSGTNSDDAAGIRDRNSAYQNKRVFSTHPYSAYILETRHISTIKPSYISSIYSGMEAGGLFAQFANDITVGGKRYKRGQNITETV